MILSLQKRFDLHWHTIGGCAAVALLYGAIMSWLASPVLALPAFCLMFAMALVTIIDLRYFTIPDVLSLPAIPLGIATSVVSSPSSWPDILVDRALAVLVAGGGLLALRWLYLKTRGVVGLGLGDVKLAAAGGAWVGLVLLHWTLLLASVAGLTAILLQSGRASSQKVTLGTKVPFGSFIAPAILIVWTWHILQI